MHGLWEELCHEKTFVVWSGTLPGFCFRNFLTIFGLFNLLLFDAYFLGRYGNASFICSSRPTRNCKRKALCGGFIACSVIRLVVQIIWNEDFPILGYVQLGFEIVTWCVHFFTECYILHRSKMIAFSFLFTFVIDVFNLYSTIEIFHHSPSNFNIIVITSTAVLILLKAFYLLTFVVHGRSNVPRSVQTSNEIRVTDEDANFFSKITYAWVWKLMQKGAKAQLNVVNDLFSLPKSLDVLVNETKFEQSLQNDGDNFLLRTIIRVYGCEFLVIAIPCLFVKVFEFAGPILLGRIVNFVEKGVEPMLFGYLYVAGMFFSTLLIAVLNNYYQLLETKLELKLKGGLSSIVYKKTLSVSVSRLASLSSGEIIDMMSTDVQHVCELKEFHETWSLLFQLIVSFCLIYNQLGAAVLSCVAYSVLLVPIVQFLCRKIIKFETRYMEFKDERVSLMNEILKGFRVIKYSAWGHVFKSKVNGIRLKEIGEISKAKYLEAFIHFFWQTSTIGMTIATFSLYIYLGHNLTAAKVFTCIAFFNMLLVPLNSLPWVLGTLMESWVSLKRLQRLFRLADVDVSEYYEKDTVLGVSNGRFKWVEDSEDGEFWCENISFDIHQGQLIGIIGKVGSGKSSIFHGILGEMFKTGGVVRVRDADMQSGFAICTQEAWVQHGTIRDNILFGKTYDQNFYNAVVECCALSDDIFNFPSRDLTEVGENGITLSGGQKARLALARAIYQDKDVYLLDDPFAAVDSDVATHIHKKCIHGLLKHKTVLLTTHRIDFLSNADRIIVIENGTIRQQGSAQEILKFSPIVTMLSSDSEMDSLESMQANDDVSDDKDKLIEDEEKEYGDVKGHVYWTYVKAMGFKTSMVILIFLLLMEGSQDMSQIWLAQWTSSVATINSTSQPMMNPTDVRFHLMVYGFIGIGNSVFVIIRALVFMFGCLRAAVALHDKVLQSILNATMRFFEMTPMGRILNRFSTDLNNIDDILPYVLDIVLCNFISLVGAVVMIVYSVYWIVFVIIPLAVIYFAIQRYYRKTSREVKRISSITMSPVYSHFSESLSGVVTIRAFRETSRFCDEIRKKLTDFLRADYTEITASIWFSFHLELLGVVLVAATSLLVIFHRNFSSSDAGFVGLAISNALMINNLLCDLVLHFTENEKLMVSVERIQQYVTSVQTERSNADVKPFLDWPNLGVIEFKGIHLRYRDDLPFVLKNIEFQTIPCEKIGIVGRTGSGKSTLLSTLFGLVDYQAGEISIDGIDIAHIPLDALRSRIAIIPQDSFLFSGTVRENLDPSSSYNDEEIWDALKLCQLEDVIQSQPLGLHFDVGEQGREFSAGQRQLMCLARAILRKTKVLCIDEATANVDIHTDTIIQNAIKLVFKDSTVLTIAHRLDTIMHCDRIIVMAGGEIIEFDSPMALLANKGSHFSKLYEK